MKYLPDHAAGCTVKCERKNIERPSMVNLGDTRRAQWLLNVAHRRHLRGRETKKRRDKRAEKKRKEKGKRIRSVAYSTIETWWGRKKGEKEKVSQVRGHHFIPHQSQEARKKETKRMSEAKTKKKYKTCASVEKEFFFHIQTLEISWCPHWRASVSVCSFTSHNFSLSLSLSLALLFFSSLPLHLLVVQMLHTCHQAIMSLVWWLMVYLLSRVSSWPFLCLQIVFSLSLAVWQCVLFPRANFLLNFQA